MFRMVVMLAKAIIIRNIEFKFFLKNNSFSLNSEKSYFKLLKSRITQ